jgi:hypothetical protein
MALDFGPDPITTGEDKVKFIKDRINVNFIVGL